MMRSGSQRARVLATAALVLGGLAAGFLLTTTVTGREYATLGTIADEDAAFAADLGEGRARFEAMGDAAARVQFALYDPDDAFFGYFTLNGDGDHVDVLVDEPGLWVVFVTGARGADLVVQRDAAIVGAEPSELVPVPVREERRTVADQRGGPLDVTLALRVQERPAMAALEYTANTKDLDAVIETELGTAFWMRDVAANLTATGVVEPEGVRDAAPQHLTTGTYEVRATAAVFEGKLELVLQSYDRLEIERLRQHATADVKSSADLPDGAVAAELEERVPVLVDAGDRRRLAFAVPDDAFARVLVYGADDAVVAIVEVGERPNAYAWEWDDDQGPDNETRYAVRELVLDRAGPVVLYAERVYSDAAGVLIIVPGAVDAPGAVEMRVVRTELVLPNGGVGGGDQGRAVATLGGGLLGVELYDSSAATASKEIRVAGPRGPVLVHAESVSALGVRLGATHRAYPERFTSGEYVIESSSEGVGGELTVRLVSYAR